MVSIRWADIFCFLGYFYVIFCVGGHEGLIYHPAEEIIADQLAIIG